MLIQETRYAVYYEFFAHVLDSVEYDHFSIDKISRTLYLLNLTEYFGKIMFVGNSNGSLDHMDQPKVNILYFIRHYFPQEHRHIKDTMIDLYDNCIFQVVVLGATRIDYEYEQEWIIKNDSIKSGAHFRNLTVFNLCAFERVLFESIWKIATLILEGKNDKAVKGIEQLLY